MTSVRRQEYIGTVVSSELYGASYYRQNGLNTSQIKALYIAQAIVANTFLEYALSEYSNHSGSSYKVCSSACCQVYDRTKTTDEGLAAAEAIFNKTNGIFIQQFFYTIQAVRYTNVYGVHIFPVAEARALVHTPVSPHYKPSLAQT